MNCIAPYRNGNLVSGARIEVKNNAKHMYSSECGEYWRLLLPGNYEVRAAGIAGFSSNWIPVEVPDLSTQALRVDLVLDQADTSAVSMDYVPGLRGSKGKS